MEQPPWKEPPWNKRPRSPTPPWMKPRAKARPPTKAQPSSAESGAVQGATCKSSATARTPSPNLVDTTTKSNTAVEAQPRNPSFDGEVARPEATQSSAVQPESANPTASATEVEQGKKCTLCKRDSSVVKLQTIEVCEGLHCSACGNIERLKNESKYFSELTDGQEDSLYASTAALVRQYKLTRHMNRQMNKRMSTSIAPDVNPDDV